MRPQTLKLKVDFYLTIGLSIAMLAFSALVVWYLRSQLLSGVSDHITQLSEVITKSTRFAMLQNQPNYVAQIIQDVAKQGSIDKVRIVSKDGQSFTQAIPPRSDGFWTEMPKPASPATMATRRSSSSPRTTGHGRSPTPRDVACSAAWRSFATSPRATTPPAISTTETRPFSAFSTSCIPWTTSSDRCETARWQPCGLSFGFIVVASLAVGLFVHRLVYVPLRDLETGARQVAAGDLEAPIPVRSGDEFGQLAASFNSMTAALRNSRSELREWGRLLEEKVGERTEELRRAQAETVRGEKLASVGLLASGIAHELNSPLTGMLTFSHLLREKAPDGSADAEDLDLVIRETRRCAAIIKRLLDFARDKTAGEEIRRPQPGDRRYRSASSSARRTCATSRS